MASVMAPPLLRGNVHRSLCGGGHFDMMHEFFNAGRLHRNCEEQIKRRVPRGERVSLQAIENEMVAAVSGAIAWSLCCAGHCKNSPFTSCLPQIGSLR